jgi:hypothetical protein
MPKIVIRNIVKAYVLISCIPLFIESFFFILLVHYGINVIGNIDPGRNKAYPISDAYSYMEFLNGWNVFLLFAVSVFALFKKPLRLFGIIGLIAVATLVYEDLLTRSILGV